METLQIGSLVYAVGVKDGDLNVLKQFLAKFGKENPLNIPVNDEPIRNLPTRAKPAVDAIKQLANETSGLRNQFQATGENGKVIADRLTVLRDSALDAAKGFANTSNEYRQLTLIAAQAERTITGINGGVTRLGIGYQVTTALQQTFGQSLLSLVPGGQSVLDLFNQMGGTLPTVGTGLNAASVGSFAATASLAGLATGLTALVGVIANLTIQGIPEVYELQKAFSVLEANGSANIQQFANDIAAVQQNTQALGDTFKKSEIGTGISELVKAGASSAEAATIIGLSTTIIAAEGGKLNEFGANLKNNLNVFDLGVDKAEKTANALAKSALLANTGVKELSAGLNVVGSTSSKADFTLEQTLAALVALDQKGLNPAEEGATGLRTALNAIAGPTPKALEQIKSLGINIEEFLGLRTRGRLELLGKAIKDTGANLEDLTDLGDTRALGVILNLAGGYDDLTKQIENSNGALDKIANSIKGDDEQAAKRYAVAVSDLSAAFAGLALPIVTPIVSGLTGFLRSVELAISPTAQLAVKVNDLNEAFKGIQKTRDLDEIDKQLKAIEKRDKALGNLQDQLAESFNNPLIGEGAKQKYRDATKELEENNKAYQKLLRLREDIVKNGQKPLQVTPIPLLNGSNEGKKDSSDAAKVYTTNKIALDEYKKSLESFTEAQLKAEIAQQKANATSAATAATAASASKNKLEEAKQRDLLSVAEAKYGAATSELAQKVREREAAEKAANAQLERSNKAYKDLNQDLAREIASRKVSSDEVARYKDRLTNLNEQYGKLSPVLRETAENLFKQADALAGVAEREKIINSLKRADREKAYAESLKEANLEEIQALKLSADKAVTVAFELLQNAKGTQAVQAAKEQLTEAQAKQNQVTARYLEILSEEAKAIDESNRVALDLNDTFSKVNDSIDIKSTGKIVDAFRGIVGSLKDGVGTLEDYSTGVATIDALLSDNTLKLTEAQKQFLQTTKDNFVEALKFLKDAADNIAEALNPKDVTTFKAVTDGREEFDKLNKQLKNGEITQQQYYDKVIALQDKLNKLYTDDAFKGSIDGTQALNALIDDVGVKAEETAGKLNQVSEDAANLANTQADQAQAASQADIDQQLKDIEAANERLKAREDVINKEIADKNAKESTIDPAINSVDAGKVANAKQKFSDLNQQLEDNVITNEQYLTSLQELNDNVNNLELTDIEALQVRSSLISDINKKLTEQYDRIDKLNAQVNEQDAKQQDTQAQAEIASVFTEEQLAGFAIVDKFAEKKRKLDEQFAKDNDLKKYNEGLAALSKEINDTAVSTALSIDTTTELNDVLNLVNAAYINTSEKIDQYTQANKNAEESTGSFIRILASQKDALVAVRNGISNIGKDLKEGLISPDTAIEGVQLQINTLERARAKLVENGQATDLVDKELANLNERLAEFKTLLLEGKDATDAFSSSLGNAIPERTRKAIDDYIARMKGKKQEEKDNKDAQKEANAALKEGADTFITYANAVSKVIEALKTLKDGKGDVIGAITDIASAAGGVIGTLAGGPAVGALVSSVIGAVGSVVSGIVDFIGDLLDPLGKQVEAKAQQLGANLSSSIAGAVESSAVKQSYDDFNKDFTKAVGKDLFKEIVQAFLKSIALEEILKEPVKAFSRAVLTPDTSDDAPALANLKAALGVAQTAINKGLPQLNSIASDLGIIEPDTATGKTKEKTKPQLVTANPSASIQVAVGTDFRVGAEKLNSAGDKMNIAADKQLQVAAITERAMNTVIETLKQMNQTSNAPLKYGS